MTGIPPLTRSSEARRRSNDATANNEITRRSGVTAISGGGSSSYIPTNFDHIFHFLGKPEEYAAKLIGGLFSDDPKYNDIFGSTKIGEQVMFAELLRDVGVDSPLEALIDDGSPGGITQFPLISSLLGLVAAIVNPLDPLNKLKIFGLTKKGITASRFGALSKSGGLIRNAAGKLVLDEKALKVSLAQAKKFVAQPGVKGDAVKAAKRTIRQVEQGLRGRKQLNAILEQAQKNGAISEKELFLAPTSFAQAQLGQRKLLGFSNPLKLDQVPGLQRGLFDEAAVEISERLGLAKLTRSMDAALIKGADKTLGNLGRLIKRKVIDAQEAMGFQVRTNDLMKALQKMMDPILQNSRVLEPRELQAQISEGFEILAREGFGPDEIRPVLQALETPDEFVGAGAAASSQMIQEMLNKNYDKLDEIASRARQTVPSPGPPINTVEGKNARDDALLLRDSGLSLNRDLDAAIRTFDDSVIPKTNVGGRDAVISQRFVTVKGTAESPLPTGKELTSLSQFDGIAKFARVKRGEDTFLIASKNPLGARMLTPFDEGLQTPGISGVFFNEAHAENLEILAAQLAAKQKSLVGIRPSDFLLTENGGILLINPSRVQHNVKGIRAAREVSREVLKDFSSTFGAFPDGSNQFRHLNSNSATRRAARNARNIKRLRRDATVLGPSSEVFGANAYDVLEQAVNTASHRAFLRGAFEGISPKQLASEFDNVNDFAVANNITNWQEKIAKDLAAGRQPTIPPIRIGVDEFGNLTIVEGRDRLLGAILNDVKNVPIHKVDITGDVIDRSRYFAGPSHDLQDVFHTGGDTAGRTAPKLIEEGFIDPTYKLTNFNGLRRILNEDALNIPSVLPEEIEKFMSLRANGAIPGREALLDQALKQAFGDSGRVAATLARMVEGSSDYREFAEKIASATKFDILDLLSPDVQTVAANLFEKNIRVTAQQHLDRLASLGVFDTGDLQNPLRLALFNGTVETFDESINALRIINSKKSAEELRKYASELLNKDVPAADIVPGQRLLLESSEGSELRQVRDFVAEGTEHPALREGIPIPRKMAITAERIQEYKEAGVLYNPDKALLSEFGGLDPNTGLFVVRTKKAEELDLAQFHRSRRTYFLTESNNIFVGTKGKHRGGEELLRDIFGEGAVSSGDLGLITHNGILIQHPLGVRMTSLSQANVTLLEKRIVQHAKKLKGMGINSDLPVQVQTQFDASVWEKLYGGKKKTINQILDSKFKLKIPKNLKDMPLDTVIEAPHASINIRRARSGLTKDQQDLFDFINNQTDDLLRKELTEALDVRFTEAYFPRVLSAGAELSMKIARADKALNQAFDGIMKGNKRLQTLRGRFQEKRVFTDLTTIEINDFIKEVRQLKNSGLDPDGIYKALKDRIISEKDVVGFQALADKLEAAGIEGGVTWFEENPLIAVAVRATESAKVRGQRQLVESLKETHGAVAFRGTTDDWKDLQDLSKDSTRFDKDIDKLKIRRLELEEELRGVKAEASQAGQELDVIGELETKIKETTAQMGDLGMQKEARKTHLVHKHGSLSHVLDPNVSDMFLEGSVARKMLESGALKEGDIISNVGEELVRVNTSKLLDNLGKEDQLIVFHDEVKPLLEKYFATTSRGKDGQWKAFVSTWDKVQGTWKQYVLFPIPAFHTRNALTDFFLSWVGGVTDPQPYADAFKTLALIRKRGKGTKSFEEVAQILEQTTLVTRDGAMTNMREIYSQWVRNGGIGTGLEYNEFANFRNSNVRVDFERRSIKAGHTPASQTQTSFLNDNKLIRNTRNFSQQTSEHFRFAVFIDTYQKTGDFQAAGINMKAALYDYQDLNEFEKNVLKRVFPFYTWMRKNIPRMVKTMVTEPVKHFRLMQFVDNWERGVNNGRPLPDEEILPWLQQFGVFPTKGRDGTFHFRGGEALIPTFDVFKMGSDPLAIFRDGMSPILKLPIEQMLNLNSRTGRPITEVEGQPAKSRTLGALGVNRRVESLFRTAFRPGAMLVDLFDKVFQENNGRDYAPGFIAGLADIVMGKSIVNDPEKAARVNASRRTYIIGSYERLINRAKKEGDPTAARTLELLLLDFQLKTPAGK